jgi:hypothetical protein
MAAIGKRLVAGCGIARSTSKVSAAPPEGRVADAGRRRPDRGRLSALLLEEVPMRRVGVVLAALLVAVGCGWAARASRRFAAEFDEVVEQHPPAHAGETVNEADLRGLPAPVARYLRAAGAVGRPRMREYRLTFTGRIRSGPDRPWMPFEAKQHSFVDEPIRLFLMHARTRGIPVQAFHRYEAGRAAMRVRLAGLVPIADASGEVMDVSETVTVLNDMCLLAPATLVDPRIEWTALDDRSAMARFTVNGHTVSATLYFGDDGLLTDVVSDDRSRASDDGQSFTRMRFRTPVGDYRDFGGLRLPAYGEARWVSPEGEYAYGEFRISHLPSRPPPAAAPSR